VWRGLPLQLCSSQISGWAHKRNLCTARRQHALPRRNVDVTLPGIASGIGAPAKAFRPNPSRLGMRLRWGS